MTPASGNGKERDMTGTWKKQPDSIPTGPIRSAFSWPESAEDHERRYLCSYLEDRFGIRHEVFDEYLLYKKNRSWWILKDSHFIRDASGLKVQTVGLKAFHKIGDFIKPTTRFIQIFGSKASRAIRRIDENDLAHLLSGKELTSDSGIDNGYVLLKLDNGILGLGLLINGSIRSQIPRRDLMNYA